MRRYLSVLIAAMASLPVMATDVAKTSSPDGRLVVTTSEEGGKIYYSATYDGKTVIEPSQLGLVANFGTLAEGSRALNDMSIVCQQSR